MKIINTKLKGAFVIEPVLHEDHRGVFMETYSEFEMCKHVSTEWVQDNMAYNKKAGIFRGYHYQEPPYCQAKLVRVVKGKVVDIIIDLRGKSPTYRQHTQVLLDDEKYQQLYVPKGFAHGYITLTDEVIFEYKVSDYYYPKHAGTIGWNDKTFDITIPYDLDRIHMSKNDFNTQTPFTDENNPFKDWE